LFGRENRFGTKGDIMNQEVLAGEIVRLREEKNILILAHYYTLPGVQKVAHFVGDSLELCRRAFLWKGDTILFAGVDFMGESAKLLCPKKRVLIPESDATCPMAHMASGYKIRKMREEIEDLAVVCYINSMASIKAESDVCVTSSNAVQVVGQLEQQNIYFIPDGNLGRYVASHVPQKQFYFGDGFCPIHQDITLEQLECAREVSPDALVLAHPECSPPVLKEADFIGSTSGILERVQEGEEKGYLILTEAGLLYPLQSLGKDAAFHFPEPLPICKDMKKITLEKILKCLEQEGPEVTIPQKVQRKAEDSIIRMMELSRNHNGNEKKGAG
jgi:quinolinate synthase